MPDYEVKHTTYEEEQAFLRLPPEQQNLKIFISSKETNGSVALALRQVAELRVQFADARIDIDRKIAEEGRERREQMERHDKRLIKLERWQLSAIAVIAFVMAASAPFFWFIDRILFQ